MPCVRVRVCVYVGDPGVLCMTMSLSHFCVCLCLGLCMCVMFVRLCVSVRDPDMGWL